MLGLSFSDNEFKVTVRVLSNAQHCNRSLFKLKFNRGAAPLLAVIFKQTAHNRLALGNFDMVRTVVAYKDTVFVKIKGMKLRKAAAYSQPIHNEHCYAGFYIELAAHRKALAYKERIA